MKSKWICTLIFVFLIILGCEKERGVTVIRDCTGTYLRFEGKDYHVCNLESISSYQNGTKLVAVFKRINQCNGSAKNSVVCHTIHQNEGWIEVEEVK